STTLVGPIPSLTWSGFRVSVTNVSNSLVQGVQVAGDVIPGLHFVRTVSFLNNSNVISFSFTLTNATGTTLTNVGFMENFDPDNNKNATDGEDVQANMHLTLSSTTDGSRGTDVTIGFGSYDPRAVAGFGGNAGPRQVPADPFFALINPGGA